MGGELLSREEIIRPLAATVAQADSMTQFQSGATRSADTDKLDIEGFVSPFVLRRYAEYLHKHRVQADGKLRDSDNWQKGMPRDRYMKSLLRHTVIDLWAQYDAGRVDQDTLCAVIFNAMGYLFEDLIAQGVADRPATGLTP